MSLCAATPAADSIGPLAWQLDRAQLGGRLSFLEARDGEFADASIHPDLEFVGWDGLGRRAEYLGGGQFYVYRPGDEVPMRVRELRFLDWEDQQCSARVEYGAFTIVKPPPPSPAPPFAPQTAAAGDAQIQIVPVQSPPLVYRGALLDVRAPSGKYSVALADPTGRIATHEHPELLPEPSKEVLPEASALAMATAQMTDAQVLQRIQQQIDGSQPPSPTPPPGAPVRVCLFEQPGFEGASLCIADGERRRDLQATIGSVRIDGGPAQVTVYEKPAFGGASVRLSSTAAHLEPLPWRARSLEVTSLEPARGGADSGVAYFFAEDGWQGYLFQVRAGDPGIADLRASGLDDAIASVRVEGDARVALYGDLYYRGREWTSTQGSTSLAVTDAFGRRASSLRVESASQPATTPAEPRVWTLLLAPNDDWTQAHRDTVINYLTWGGGEWTAAYLGGGRFRHTQRGATRSRESIGVNYIDWKGGEWTATVEGEKFRHTRRDGKRDEVDRAIHFKTWGGDPWSAKLVPPASLAAQP
ncbi:MAG TPA: hypothetical protein VFY49_20620 [Myxococcota bacterium]|nr:hypothetical protein [Myxococcota bacterium]